METADGSEKFFDIISKVYFGKDMVDERGVSGSDYQ